MKRIIVLRHGSTDYNNLEIFQGQIDIDINEMGRKQMLRSLNTISFSNMELIVSSPLKRAIQSAQIIQEELKIKIDIYNEFTERSLGIYEGLNKKEVKNSIVNKYFSNTLRNVSFQPLNGESIIQVFQRVMIGLQKIHSINPNNILIVTHGTIAKVIDWLLSKKCPSDFFSFSLNNAKHISYNLLPSEIIIERYLLILQNEKVD